MTRTATAKTIGRMRTYGDERRRLLSIVAWDYSYRTLQQYFSCADDTIVAARVHALLFGRGGVPKDSIKVTRQCIGKDVMQEFMNFLHRDDVSRPSCRSVVVEGEETAVRYWQSTIKEVVQQ